MSSLFNLIPKGSLWTRKDLATLWGYKSFHALARGVVTPAGHNCIILFVTQKKQNDATQYDDHIEGNKLFWEGEQGHQNDLRIMNAHENCNDIHVFFRDKHHMPFQYLGRAKVLRFQRFSERPSRFEFELTD